MPDLDFGLERINFDNKAGLNLLDINRRVKKVLKPNKTYLLKVLDSRFIYYEEYVFLKWFGDKNDLALFVKISSNVKESFSIIDIGTKKVRIKEI